MKNELIYPMAFYVFLMWAYAIHTFRTRVAAVRSGKVNMKYFVTRQGEIPDEIAMVGRHYDNQFQLPMLFLVTCLLNLQMDKVNTLTIVLAWLFIATRLLHSWHFLGKNIPLKRARAFAFGWLVMGAMWIQVVYFAVN